MTRILLIDDDALARDILQQMLERAGYLGAQRTLRKPLQRLELLEARAQLDEGGIANVTGTFDFTQKLIRGGHIGFSGPIPATWLPPAYAIRDISCSADFNGRIDDLQHSISIRVRQLQVPRLKNECVIGG